MYRDTFQRHAILRALVYLVTLIAVLYAGGLIWGAIGHFSGIITLFFLAWIIAFTLQPLSTFLERHGMPRVLAIAMVYFALLALAAGSIILAIPALHAEVSQLAIKATATFTPDNLNRLTETAVGYLHRLGLRRNDARAFVSQLANRIPSVTASLASSAVATSTSLLSAAASLLFDSLLVLILSFYIMLDGDRLAEEWIGKLPPAWIADVRLFQSHVDAIFGGFLRAQLIIAGAYGLLTYVVLLIMGQPNGLVFAFLAAIAMLIPFVGPFLAVVPPLLVVLLQSPPDRLALNLVIVLVALGVAQQITMQVIAPRVMSAHVGLPPLLLFAALLVGAQEGGIWGAVFAGPIAAVLVAMLDTFFERFQQRSPLYPHIMPQPETAAEYDSATRATARSPVQATDQSGTASDAHREGDDAARVDTVASSSGRDSSPPARDDQSTLLDRLLRR
jgi:predicted PurR-regulated permease PerM